MMTKTVTAGVLSILLASFGVSAASQGGGVVNFKGTVVEAPCSIAPESADQSINFGQISKSHLASGGISIQRSLDIKLANCDVTGLPKKVQVTFSGNTEGGTELATSGTTNTAVVINGYGSDITFGKSSDFVPIIAGDNTLHFVSWVKQAADKTVAEGDFTAVANFNLAYN